MLASAIISPTLLRSGENRIGAAIRKLIQGLVAHKSDRRAQP
jgi:hypothetical protein